MSPEMPPEMDATFNMTLRKFLKEVGVTSQQAIEAAMREAGPSVAGQPIALRMVLTIDALDVTHTVTGTITGPQA
jgi:hypothetical protein